MTSQHNKNYTDYWQKSLWERAFFAILYEVCAILILAPISAYLFNKPLSTMWILTLLLATVAMIWNMIYNAIFERIEHALKITRTPRIRIIQAVFFEGGLIFLLVPVAAWFLSCSYWQAFKLDIGFFCFYLPYTYLFTWIYDMLRKCFIEHYILSKKTSPKI